MDSLIIMCRHDQQWCEQGEGREAVVPLMGLPGTSEGPARLVQQVGGARDPASLHMGQYSGRSHQGLHWDYNREAWEQPRQRLSSRGVSQASWRSSEDSSAREHQASPACSPEKGTSGAEAHCDTAGDTVARKQWLDSEQLEVWAIDEMVEPPRSNSARRKLSRAAARRLKRSIAQWRHQRRSAHWRGQEGCAW